MSVDRGLAAAGTAGIAAAVAGLVWAVYVYLRPYVKPIHIGRLTT